MPQEQVFERMATVDGHESAELAGRRRETKHPASEVRRLIVAAAKALPADKSLWFRKLANPRWSR